jgi:hypothetical protein
MAGGASRRRAPRKLSRVRAPEALGEASRNELLALRRSGLSRSELQARLTPALEPDLAADAADWADLTVALELARARNLRIGRWTLGAGLALVAVCVVLVTSGFARAAVDASISSGRGGRDALGIVMYPGAGAMLLLAHGAWRLLRPGHRGFLRYRTGGQELSPTLRDDRPAPRPRER